MKNKILIRILITVITIFCAEAANSQVIINLLDKDDIGFQPSSKIDFVEIINRGYGSSSTEKLRYDDDLKILNKKVFDAGELTFSMSWEYDSLNRLVEQTREYKDYFGLNKTKTTFHWIDFNKIHTENVGTSNKILYRSQIHLDSCMNPIEITTYSPNGDVIGKEVAQYDYKNNLVEIYIYDQNDRLLGVTLSNIFYKNIGIQFKDYIKHYNWNVAKSKAKDWTKFEIVMFYRNFKFDKNNNWKSYTLERIYFNPSKKEYTKVFNDVTKRKIRYAK